MKIAIMVTGYMESPIPMGVTCAPTGLAIAISEGLQNLGHKVDFYGPEGTYLNVPVVTCGLKPFINNGKGVFLYPGLEPGNEVGLGRTWNEFYMSEMIRRSQMGDYDVIMMFATVADSLILGRLAPAVKIVYTLHDPIFPWLADIYRKFLTPNQHIISITESQRKPAQDLNYLANIYNGIDVGKYEYNNHPSDFVVFAGRMVEEKNPLGAIEAARLASAPIKLFGEVRQGEPTEYFNTIIKPQLDKDATYCGFVSQDELAKQYGEAKALLAPITWDEPFGLVFIEAMACGTPVIAFRRGSVPEIIVDGVTGFIVDTVEEMAEAIKKIDTIDRKACREHVVNKFSNEKMIKSYEEALKRVVEAS